MDNSVTDYNNSTIHISQFANTTKKTKTNQAKDNRGTQATTAHVGNTYRTLFKFAIHSTYEKYCFFIILPNIIRC